MDLSSSSNLHVFSTKEETHARYFLGGTILKKNLRRASGRKLIERGKIVIFSAVTPPRIETKVGEIGTLVVGGLAGNPSPPTPGFRRCTL